MLGVSQYSERLIRSTDVVDFMSPYNAIPAFHCLNMFLSTENEFPSRLEVAKLKRNFYKIRFLQF
jgi:hypothetical protein